MQAEKGSNLLSIFSIVQIGIYAFFAIYFCELSFIVYGILIFFWVINAGNKKLILISLLSCIILNSAGFAFYSIQTGLYGLPKLGGTYKDDETYIIDAINLANCYRISYLWSPDNNHQAFWTILLSNANTGYTFVVGTYLKVTQVLFGSYSIFNIIIFNNFFGIIFVQLTYKISYKISHNAETAIRSALLCLFYPMTSFYSSAVLKDMLTGVVVSILFYLAFWKKRSLGVILAIVIFFCVLSFVRINIAIPLIILVILASGIPRYNKVSFKSVYKSTSFTYKIVLFLLFPLVLFILGYIFNNVLVGYQEVASGVESYSSDNSFRYINALVFIFLVPFPAYRSIIYAWKDSMTYYIWSDLGAVYWHLLILPFALLGFWQFYKRRTDNYLLLWFVGFMLIFTVSLFVDERRRIMFAVPFFVLAGHFKFTSINYYCLYALYLLLYLLINLGYLYAS